MVYALYALGCFFVLPTIIAIILAHVRVPDARGTWLESHFLWQIRTFWYGLLWAIIAGVLAYFLVGFVLLLAVVVWWIYRIAKGWLRLNDGKEMYHPS